jgi:hypothetical protein
VGADFARLIACLLALAVVAAIDARQTASAGGGRDDDDGWRDQN